MSPEAIQSAQVASTISAKPDSKPKEDERRQVSAEASSANREEALKERGVSTIAEA
jgi:hypothetical protein